MPPDPFAHHPGLRGKIVPPETSHWRSFTAQVVVDALAAQGLPPLALHDDATRAHLLSEALAGHEGDLWIFAYGSLIWDPALVFAEVRRAYAPGHRRAFVMDDTYGGRGTVDVPGLMAGLDVASAGDGGCHGLCYRIAADHVAAETEILCRRELLAPGYLARMIPVVIDGDEVRALTFLADHGQEGVLIDVPRAEQVRRLATGKGFLGSSHDYLRNIVDHLHDMDIPDPDLDALLAETEAEMARLAERER